MGRKTQISKETMLQAAYEILVEEGYSMVNIKTVASRVGCSTQPISWQFGNMLNMREELYKYSMEKLFEGLNARLSKLNAVEAFFETGKIYISNAIDHPNVFKFLCVDGANDLSIKDRSFESLLGDEFIKEMLSKELSLPREKVDRIVADVVIYTHGLATMLLWDSFLLDRKTAFQMIYDQGVMCFTKYGVDAEKYITKTGE